MDDIVAELEKLEATREKRRKVADFKAWSEGLDRTPRGTKLRLKDGFVAEVELQPMRWLKAGLDVLESANVTSWVQLMGGRRGPPMQSFLPYPVFLSGTELFLKGMWLCRFPECRRVAHRGYVKKSTREKYEGKLRAYGHDLLKLIKANRRLGKYRNDRPTLMFLNRIEALIRLFYYPYTKPINAALGPVPVTQRGSITIRVKWEALMG